MYEGEGKKKSTGGRGRGRGSKSDETRGTDGVVISQRVEDEGKERGLRKTQKEKRRY